MTDRESDRVCDEYLIAVAEEDFDTLERIWDLAGLHPELEAALHELNVELRQQDVEATVARDTMAIEDAVRTHLPAARIDEAKTGPVTLADVAAELFREPPPQWAAELHAFNESLRNNPSEVPETKSLTKLLAWAQSEFRTIPSAYWSAFREVAIRLKASRSDAEYGLAARSAKPRRPS